MSPDGKKGKKYHQKWMVWCLFALLKASCLGITQFPVWKAPKDFSLPSKIPAILRALVIDLLVEAKWDKIISGRCLRLNILYRRYRILFLICSLESESVFLMRENPCFKMLENRFGCLVVAIGRGHFVM